MEIRRALQGGGVQEVRSRGRGASKSKRPRRKDNSTRLQVKHGHAPLPAVQEAVTVLPRVLPYLGPEKLVVVAEEVSRLQGSLPRGG